MTRAAIYARVSTPSQEENSSLGSQEAACRTHAVAKGYFVAAVFRESESGDEFWGRPQLTALRESIRAGELDIVLVDAVDRLVRNQAHWFILRGEMERASVHLECVAEHAEDRWPGSTASSLMPLMAEVERDTVRKRTHRGLRERAKMGALLGGRELFGYQYRDPATRTRARTVFVEKEPEATVVRDIFQDLANGGSANAVARRLTEQGRPTPKGGREWTPRVIINMVRNPAYKGVAEVFRTKLVRGRAAQPTPEAERVRLPTGTIPPLVDHETWQAANTQVDRNRTSPSRQNRCPEAFLLRSGLACCGHCGHPLVATTTHGRRYLCAMQNRRLHGCPHTSIRATELDIAVWNWAIALLKDRATQRTWFEARAETVRTAADVDAIERALAELLRLHALITSAVVSLSDEVATPLVIQLRILREQATTLELERHRILTRHAHLQAAEALLARLCDGRADVEPLVFQERRSILEMLGVRVWLWPKGHEPRYTIEASAGSNSSENKVRDDSTTDTFPAAAPTLLPPSA